MKNVKESQIKALKASEVHEVIYNRLVEVRKEKEEKDRQSVLHEVEAAVKGRDLIMNNMCV